MHITLVAMMDKMLLSEFQWVGDTDVHRYLCKPHQEKLKLTAVSADKHTLTKIFEEADYKDPYLDQCYDIGLCAELALNHRHCQTDENPRTVY